MFSSSDGRKFEWRRRLHDDPNSYDVRLSSSPVSGPVAHFGLQLYTEPDRRIAIFRRFVQLTPVGPSHAVLQYAFNNDLLLLEALLALCLNRWIDWCGI
jgi:hypothetical protein